jgi:hypothetical protein
MGRGVGGSFAASRPVPGSRVAPTVKVQVVVRGLTGETGWMMSVLVLSGPARAAEARALGRPGGAVV